MTTADIERAQEILAGARRITVLTGAGISAESGVPTFRGEGGLWKTYRAQDLATPAAFSADPRLVWEWYSWRRELIRACSPNPAHRTIARAACASERVQVVTQNVDGLHDRAVRDVWRDSSAAAANATASEVPPHALPVRLHGWLFGVKCSRCDHHAPHRDAVDATCLDTLPRCPVCRALLRPDVVWFGEALDPRVIESAWNAAKACDVCLVVGTSGIVYPAAGIPRAAADAGASIIEVNPYSTPVSALADVILRAPAGEAVPALFRFGEQAH